MTGGTDGHAEDQGRVYQARGDQQISEHHHYGGGGPERGGPDSVRRPAVGRSPVALRDRSEVMERLRASLEEERGGQVYVLYGMGGSGKTAVACALFQEATGEQGRVGLWVNASDRASLRAGMLAVAADRGRATANCSPHATASDLPPISLGRISTVPPNPGYWSWTTPTSRRSCGTATGCAPARAAPSW